MEVKRTHGNGNHLIVEALFCDKVALANKETITKFLTEFPAKINMHAISDANVIEYKPEDNEGGITGVIFLAESHISIHSYPHKGFASIDVFSCNEFDIDVAKNHIKDFFSSKRIESQFIKRSFNDAVEYEENLTKVSGKRIFEENNVQKLINMYENIGFQATELARAVKIIQKMREDNTTIFLTFTSNLVTSGLRDLFTQIVKNKLVDVIITSTGAIEEDIMRQKGPFLIGDFNFDDKDLHKAGINRVGNIFIPDDRYMFLEDFLKPIFEKFTKQQNETNKLVSPTKLIREIGLSANDEDSYLYWAAKNDIPIFCPGITDGAIGLQLYFFKQKNNLGIDVTDDMKVLADLTLNSEKTGAIILGGGIAKHHTIGVNILREGLDYAVYITTASEYDGSLSGAKPKEAKSWSKIKEEANSVCVDCDATIAFPLIAWALKK